MKFLLYGSKDFASTVAELVRHCGHEVVGMIDDFSSGPSILGPLTYVRKTHPPSGHVIAMAIGYNNLPARWNVWEQIRAAGYQTPPLVHPRAYVADTARLEGGALVMAGAIVDVRARVGEASVLWPGACINHDSNIGNNTFVSPCATICGHVDVGAHSFIGAGAVVVDHCRLPESSYLKMLARYTGNQA